MGLQFVTPERRKDHGYITTIDGLSYSLRHEGHAGALYVYPQGRPDMLARLCGEALAMTVLNQLHDGEYTPQRLMVIFKNPVPGWLKERL